MTLTDLLNWEHEGLMEDKKRKNQCGIRFLHWTSYPPGLIWKWITPCKQVYYELYLKHRVVNCNWGLHINQQSNKLHITCFMWLRYCFYSCFYLITSQSTCFMTGLSKNFSDAMIELGLENRTSQFILFYLCIF